MERIPAIMMGMIDLKARWGLVTDKDAMPIPDLAVPYAVPMLLKVMARATPPHAKKLKQAPS